MNAFVPCIAVALCLFVAVPGAQGENRPLFDRDEQQLGTLSEGRVHHVTIPLKNVAGRPLRILSVNPTCVYLEASLDRSELETEGTATLTVLIDTEGNLGKIAKTVEILTNVSSEPHIVTVRGAITHREYDRGRPQTMFTGACKKCHIGTGVATKTGLGLYDAVCYLCHKDSLLNSGRDYAAVRQIIQYGVRGTSMPGFAESSGGPLSILQIDSIAGLLESQRRPAGN